MKKLIAMLLALAMVLSLAACAKEEAKPKIEGDTNDDGSITVGQAGVKAGVNEVDVTWTLPKLSLPVSGKLCSPLLRSKAALLKCWTST